MKELDLRVLWDLLLRNLRIIILFVSIVAVIFGGVTIVFQEDLKDHRHRHPEGAAGTGVSVPRHGNRPDGYGHRQRCEYP